MKSRLFLIAKQIKEEKQIENTPFSIGDSASKIFRFLETELGGPYTKNAASLSPASASLLQLVVEGESGLTLLGASPTEAMAPFVL